MAIWHYTGYLILIIVSTTRCANSECNDGDTFGSGLSVARNETDTGDEKHEAFLDYTGVINCHGAVRAWSFTWMVSGRASCHDVMLQLWRPVNANNYMLIGQTLFSPTILQCEPYATEESSSAPTTAAITTTNTPTTTPSTDSITDIVYDFTDTTEYYTDTTEPATTTVLYTTTTTATTTVTTTSMPDTTPYDYPERELIHVDLMPAEYIPVQPGDLYGWMDVGAGSGERRIPFQSASSGSGQFGKVLILSSGSVTGTVGEVVDWSAADAVVRNYSLSITLTTRESPYIISPSINCSDASCEAIAHLRENRPPGDFMFRAVAINDYNYSTVIPPTLEYSITDDNCSAFDIDTVTGDVKTRATLDFETLAGSPTILPVICTVAVTARDGARASLPVYSAIKIVDVNEPHNIQNLPDWTPPLDVTTLTVTSSIYDVLLIDDDDPKLWPPKTFSIVYSSPVGLPFDISSGNTSLWESFGAVEVTQDMTYWPGPSICTVDIMASDGYHYDGPLELVVQLKNIRERPIIVNLPAIVYVQEGIVGTGKVYKVVGQPMPANRTDDLVYSISNVYPRIVAASLFTINSITGEITYNASSPFDYFEINPYHVEVVVEYVNGTEQTSDPKNLTVAITWVNQQPYFEDVDLNDTLTADVPETQAMGTYLPNIVLTGKDRDVPVGDWVYYSITGSCGHLFTASNVTNRIHVMDDLALALLPGQSSYQCQMDLWVIDSFGSHSNIGLIVNIIDVNNHAPVTDSVEYYGQVPGDVDGPLDTGVAIAIDDDDGPSNANIDCYVLEHVARLYFEVNASVDVITKQPIPYSAYQHFAFTVFITDNGAPIPLNTTVQVFIDVLPSDANPPVFSPTFDSLDLRMDTAVDSVIYTLVAYDIDNSSIEYSLWSASDFYRLHSSAGTLLVQRKLVAYDKEILYVYAKDAAHYSDTPFTLRIDTYNPKDVLVDIYLHVSLSDFLETRDAFLDALNDLFPYWDVRIESYKHNEENTIVTVYAVESSLPDQPGNEVMDKVFIKERHLIDVLRSNLQGDPSDELLGPEFAEWKPYKVEPAHPTWITDTPGGVAFLTLLCLLGAAGLITLLVLLAKKYRWCCYKTRRTPSLRPTKVHPVGPDYQLYYTTLPKHHTVFHTGVTPPFVPFPSKGSTRASLNEHDREADILPPVSVDDNGRPLPRQQTGTAA